MKLRSRRAWGQVSNIPLDTEKARKWATLYPILTRTLIYSSYPASGKEDVCRWVTNIGVTVRKFSYESCEQGFKPWTTLPGWLSRLSRVKQKACAARLGHVEETGRMGDRLHCFSSFLLLLASFSSNSLESSALHLKADFLQSFWLVRNGVGLKPTDL